MKRFTGLLVAILVLAVAIPAQAQEEKKKKKSPANAQPTAIAQLMKSLEKAGGITDEQEVKIKAIVAKHKDKLVELHGPEANKAMNEARKAGTEAGKKGKELAAAVRAASGLSEEKLKQLDELTEVTTVTTTALKKEVLAVLTEEQREKSGIKLPAKAGGDAPKKKNKEAKDN